MKQPVWISHRGLCKGHDENSLEAFSEAVAAGFDYLETDLRSSSDGELFLSHDRSLERVAGIDRQIDDLNSSEIKEIKMHKGNRLLSFEDFLLNFNDRGHVFDIKPETGTEVVDLVCQHTLDLNKTIFLFWDLKQEKKLREKWPQAICFARYTECQRAGLATVVGLPMFGGIQQNRTYSLPPGFKGIRLFKKRIVDCFHNRGARLVAFLPQNLQETQSAIEAGFDYILTNETPIR